MSSIRTEVGLHPLDIGGDRRVRQKMDAMSVKAICHPSLAAVRGWPDDASLRVFPKNREESVAQRPAGHRQLPDDR